MIYVTFNTATGTVNFPAYGSRELVPSEADFIPVEEAEWNAAQGKSITIENGRLVVVDPPATAADYDGAMEAHLLAERSARGYTTREPSEYLDSSVPRWAKDAADWVAHRDAVMLYGLEVQNAAASGGEVPTLDAFRAALPSIVWTYKEEA